MNPDRTQTGSSPDPVSTPDAVQNRRPPRTGRPADRSRQDVRRRNLFILASCILFALLASIRVLNIWSNTPEYDEIWTVQHYRNLPVPAVFSDVATPNNHVLNTLGIKFFLTLMPHHNFAVRLTVASLGRSMTGSFVSDSPSSAPTVVSKSHVQNISDDVALML